MKKIITKGFTLIELLVVIAIIALLASIILASLNTARSKGRDANRVQSLQEMAKAISLADTDPAVAFAPNTAACATTAHVNVTGCTTPTGLTSYKDPSGNVTACGALAAGTVGSTASTQNCQYSVSTQAGAAGPTTQNYEVCTVLENGNAQYGGTAATYGAVRVDNTSSTGVVAGCN